MQNLDTRVIRIINWFAAAIAIVIAVSSPLVYFYASYVSFEGVLDAEAEINGRIASEVINANPTLWRFQTPKLEEFLKRRSRRGHAEVRRVVDNDGKIIAESSETLSRPIIIRSADLLDAGVKVARIDIARSLQPLLVQTFAVMSLGTLLGMIVFYALRVLPRRALSRAIAENARLVEELQRRSEELKRSNQELEQFAYVASHDLQEPLRMITGYTNLLAKRYQDKLGQDAHEFIAFAVDGAKRMHVLINDLLSYSRVGTREKVFAPTNCEVALDRVLVGLQVAIQESGAKLTHDPLPTIMGDESQISQLLQNLVANALKYRDGKAPQIHIGCARDGTRWKFSVKDNGIGIDPKYADKIFVIFQRLHTKQEYPGTGIGLAVCKKIVDRHGGRIWVESELGKGATFYFTMPNEPQGVVQ